MLIWRMAFYGAETWTLRAADQKSFYQQIGLKFEEETNKMPHLEHGFVWC